MMLKNKFTLLFILLLSLVFSFTDNPVKYDINFSKDKIAPGDDFSISINIDIDPGFLIYSPNPLNLSPTGIEWDREDSTYFEYISPMEEPESKIKIDPYIKMEVFYHTGSVNFKQNYKLKSNLNPGDTIILNGEFIYQACDDRLCVPYWDEFSKIIYIDNNFPDNDSIDNNLTVKLEKEKIFPHKKDFDQIENPCNSHQSQESSDEVGSDSDDVSILIQFLIAFLAGLAAIITPCVFPMIPMTVAFFSKGTSEDRNKSIKTGLIFGGSIIFIFITCGILFSFLFKSADLMNDIATGPIANIIFAIVFIVFAISFFGAFEIRIPNRFLNKINQKSDLGGLLGTFFMALTLVLVSFSCTAPIVGTVIINALEGSFWGPVIVMLGFSLAFAIPFSLFAAFPSWLENLPKSGNWLNTVKIIFGFLELALAIKFLSMPDQSAHWDIMPRNLFIILWFIIFFSMGLYLLGIIKFKGDNKVIKFGFGRVVISILTFCFCGYLILGVFKVTSLTMLSGIIPPVKGTTLASCDPPENFVDNNGNNIWDLGENFIDTNQNGTWDDGIEFKYGDLLYIPHNLKGYFDYEDAAECGIKSKKPLFIDFTGHACFNCRRMEEIVWSDERVLKILREEYVVVALYVDDRTLISKDEWYRSDFDGKDKKMIGKKNFFIQLDKFDQNAQPWYVLLDPHDACLDKPEPLANPKGYDTDIESFIKFLDEGINKFKENEMRRNEEND